MPFRKITLDPAEVARLRNDGFTAWGIAAALDVSLSTVFRVLRTQAQMRVRRRWRSPGFEDALDACGGKVCELARRLGIVPQAVSKWRAEIPPRWVAAVEKATGVKVDQISSDN